MRISVVIPTYNAARLLPRALESVFRQSVPCEAIVVDDGSTDATGEVVREFVRRNAQARGRLRYVRQANAGPSRARNHGVERSRGDWIAFLDADDYWYAHKLQAQQQHIRAFPGAAACFSGVDVENVDGQRYRRLPPADGPVGWEQMVLGNLVPSPTPLICREVFDAVRGFDEQRRFTEDWDFWLRVTEVAPLVAQREALACYWDNDTGLHRDPRRLDAAWSVLANSLARMHHRELRPRLADRAFAALHLREAYDHMLQGHSAATFRLAARTLRFDWRRVPVATRICIKGLLRSTGAP